MMFVFIAAQYKDTFIDSAAASPSGGRVVRVSSKNEDRKKATLQLVAVVLSMQTPYAHADILFRPLRASKERATRILA